MFWVGEFDFRRVFISEGFCKNVFLPRSRMILKNEVRFVSSGLQTEIQCFTDRLLSLSDGLKAPSAAVQDASERPPTNLMELTLCV